MDCIATKHDRWRTVHRCVVEANANGKHVGLHETADGFFWADDAALIPNRYVTLAVRYDGHNAHELDRIDGVTLAKSGLRSPAYTPVTLQFRDGMTKTLFPGEWLVRYDDDELDTVRADLQPKLWRTAVHTAPAG